jgi:NAD(P)-dependent dehydrogenase (short-subunit alcohol dehydrogenase family)
MNSTTPSVTIVAGVGPGLGASLCRRMTGEGYVVAGLARTAEYGNGLAGEIKQVGQRMSFYACDVADSKSVDETVSRIEEDLGKPEILIYNAGAFMMKETADTTPEEMRRLWEINCYGAFLCARRVISSMLESHRGTILFTGATASIKAAGNFAAFGSSKFALRGLAQSMARELGPQGIHVAHIIIDGIIATPRTRKLPGVTPEQCLNPNELAETYLHLIQQDRSAWTFELDLRPDVESF